MSLTIAVVTRRNTRNGKEIVADVTFDSSYPTGGESLTAADLRCRRIEHVQAQQKGVASRIVEYDYANSKLMLFTALSTQAANASDQSTIVVRICVKADHFSALKK